MNLPIPQSGLLNRLIDAAIAACGAVAMLSIAGMGALITLDVTMRNLGFGGVRGGVEAVEYLMFVTALFAAPWVLRHNAHIRIDFLVENARRPVAVMLEAAANAIGLLVIGVLIFYASRIGLQSAAEERRIYKTFIFPEWWIYAAGCAALALLWIEFLRRIVRALGAGSSRAAGG